MNMRGPFQVPDKNVQDTNEPRGEKPGFVVFVEHA